MIVQNYTSAEFLGVFLIGFPMLFFITTILFKGIYWLFDRFLVDLKQNVFHHHYYHKDRL